MTQPYDLIGDIHGHAAELAALLYALGYRKLGDTHRHPDGRKVVFLGDYIDRGPAIRDVLRTVRGMVDAGDALAIQGNHEFNAVGFATPDGRGDFLRRHSEKNLHQHGATLEQLSEPERADWIGWFRTLPMWLDLPGLRAVHACWDDALVAVIAERTHALGFMTPAFLHEAFDKTTPLFAAVDATLKGKEAVLPAGVTFEDRYGEPRTAVRTRWFESPAGRTFGEYAMQSDPIQSPVPVGADVIAAAKPYPADAPPVFMGHYWLSGDPPILQAPNVACLDYSVAKDGYLCSYRWDGEATLDAGKFLVAKSP